MRLVLVNESTKLAENDAFNIAWAINWQLRYQFGRSGWRSDCSCTYLPGGSNATIPSGACVLHMLDTSDQPGALGYHDENGNEVPYARIFVQTALEDGDQPSEVASHEALELAADPNVYLTAVSSNENRLYAVEVGDPVQGNGYDVLEPSGKTSGIIVADFTLPNYYDSRTRTTVATDYHGAVQGPFALGPQGYYSYIDLNNVQAGWTQKTGSERTKPVVDPDDRDRISKRVTPGVANA